MLLVSRKMVASDRSLHRSRPRFAGFALISGIGWSLDFMVMAGLAQLGVPIFWANMIGAFCAVTLVFFASNYCIFRNTKGRSTLFLLTAYWVWQVVAITAASALIATISSILIELWPQDHAFLLGTELRPEAISGMASKALVTPATLIANFLFLHLLMETRVVGS